MKKKIDFFWRLGVVYLMLSNSLATAGPEKWDEYVLPCSIKNRQEREAQATPRGICLTCTNYDMHKMASAADSVKEGQQSPPHYFIPSDSLEVVEPPQSAKSVSTREPVIEDVPVFRFYEPDTECGYHLTPSFWSGLNASLAEEPESIEANVITICLELRDYGRIDDDDLQFQMDDAAEAFINPHAFGKWGGYSHKQLATLTLLLEHLVEKYKIPRTNIFSHAVVTTDRGDRSLTSGPGPFFPWVDLYDKHKLGYVPKPEQSNETIDVAWVYKKLKDIGFFLPAYADGIENHPSFQWAVNAYRMQYMPGQWLMFSGNIDQALCESLAGFDIDLFSQK